LAWITCGVGAGVVHDVDPQRLERVFELHEAVDRRPDDRMLVPGRDQDRRAREHGLALSVVQPPEVQPHQQELVVGDQQRDGAEQHERHEQPLDGPQELGHHAAVLENAPSTMRRTEE
jgi:hypothetical protein